MFSACCSGTVEAIADDRLAWVWRVVAVICVVASVTEFCCFICVFNCPREPDL